MNQLWDVGGKLVLFFYSAVIGYGLLEGVLLLGDARKWLKFHSQPQTVGLNGPLIVVFKNWKEHL